MNVARMPKEGDRFGNWIIERTLDKGGMGMVYLAYNPDLGKSEKVALKVLDPAIAETNPNFVRRFYQEASIVFKTHCQNLVSIHDAGRDAASGFYYIVMEYLGGGTLRDRMKRRGPIPWREALKVIRPVALALNAVAKRKSVHRDIKPENIMFTDDGVIKLADFGIAKVAQDETDTSLHTSHAQIFGTPAYMSPDQVMDSAAVDARADIWSLGIVLFEMLAGRRPFVARDFMQAASFLLSSKPIPDVRKFNKSVNVPPGVADLLSRMCDKNLDKRIATSQEVIDAIDGLLSSSGSAKLRRVVKVLTIAIAFVLAGASALFFLRPHYSAIKAQVGEFIHSFDTPPSVRVESKADTNQSAVAEEKRTPSTQDEPPVSNQVAEVTEPDKQDVSSKRVPDKKVQPQPIPPPQHDDPDPTFAYMEIAKIDAEIIAKKKHVESIEAKQLKEYESDKATLGIETGYEQARGLISNLLAQAESFSDLASASNAWQAVQRDYRQLAVDLERFAVARRYYAATRTDREFAIAASNELVDLELTLKGCGYQWRRLEEFRQSMAVRRQAEREFGERQYQSAARSYAEAVSWATNALQKAQEGNCLAAKESVKVHLANQNWRRAEKMAEEAMRWVPKDSEALRLKGEARSHLYATLTLCATVEGKPVTGAKIVKGDFALNKTLPWTSAEMEKLTVLDPFEVEYAVGDRRWKGAFKGITVDWTGEKQIKCPLTECERPPCEFVPVDLQQEAEFLVIDLASGPNSKQYPVSYLAEPPREWTGEYKSTKLVLRRVRPGSFNHQAKVSAYTVTLTKTYYIGVFEVTYPQWKLVMGNYPSCMEIGEAGSGQHYESGNIACRVHFTEIRGEKKSELWPESNEVDEESFLGRLRKRTGITTLDLPTEGQWELACRAGSETEFHTGDGTKALERAGWYRGNSVPWSLFGSDSPVLHEVGLLQPNRWGLYDMHGNVEEWCLDHVSMSFLHTALKGINPIGAKPEDDGFISCTHRIRGGGFLTHDPSACAASARSQGSSKDIVAGLRIVAN